jgi:poly(A) polymerase
VAYSTPEFDASRRDFTINGMFYDPLTKQVIDFVGGQTDLTNRNLRAIGDPVARFKEDKLRLIRAARFAARFALTIDPATREALEVHAREITQVAGERIAQELRRMLCHPTRADAIRLAWNHELLTSVLPQLKPLEKDDRKDSTLHVLERLPRTADASLGFAALLHDLIEYPTSGATPDVEPRDQGRQIANLLTRQLRLSNAERDTISWIIGHRLELEHAQELRIARLKRLLSEKPCEQTRDLIEARAQVLGANRDTVLFLRNYSTTLPDGPINPPRLVSGKDLIRCLGLRPGPGFKDVLEQLYDAQLEQTVCSKEEALDWIRDWYIANPRAE